MNLTYFGGFGGYRKEPTVFMNLTPARQPGQFTVQPTLNYDWIHLVGVDFSASVAGTVIRGEAAYTFTEDPDGSEPAVGNPSFEAVLGTEYTFGDLFTSLQGIVEYVRDDHLTFWTVLTTRYKSIIGPELRVSGYRAYRTEVA